MDEIRKQVTRAEDEKTRYKSHYEQAEQELKDRRKRIAGSLINSLFAI